MTFTLNLSLSLDECAQDLTEAFASARKRFRFRMKPTQDGGYSLTVTRVRRFSRNDMKPSYWGSLQPDADGCVLTGTFRMYPLTRILVWFWVIFATLAILPNVISFLERWLTGTSTLSLWNLIGGLMCWPGLGLTVIFWGRFVSGGADERDIKAFLQETLCPEGEDSSHA